MAVVGRGYPSQSTQALPSSFAYQAGLGYQTTNLARSRPVFTSLGSGAANANCNGVYANITHTIPVGTSALLVAADVSYANGTLIPTLIGSSPLTLLGGILWRSYTGVWVWGMVNPPSGVQTIGVGTNSYAASVTFNSFTYNNVSGFGTPVTNTGATSSMSQTVTATPVQTVFSAFGTLTGTSITSYSQMPLWINSSGNQLMAIGESYGSSTVTSTTSATPTYGWASVAVPLIPTEVFYNEPSSQIPSSSSVAMVTRGGLI